MPKCDMCSLPIRKGSHTLDGMHPDCALTPDTVALMAVLKERGRRNRKKKK